METIWGILLELLKYFGIAGIIGAAFVAYITKLIAQIEALKVGLQAVLRSQMVSDFNKWNDRGYAPIYARQNFENCWKQYHTLGANGVMDNIHDLFLALPPEPPNHED